MEQKDMEVKKDIQNDRYLAHSIVFQQDKKTFALYHKTEKIVAAIYLVTNFFPAEEPLVVSLRTCGISMLSFIASLPLSPDAVKQGESCLRIKAKTLELVSWCDLSEAAGYLSSMNAGVIRCELLKVARQAEEWTAETQGGVRLHSELFAVDAGALPPSVSKTGAIFGSPLWETDKGHYKGQKDTKADTSSRRPVSHTTGSVSKKTSAHASDKKSVDRSAIILGLFKQKDRLNVKDVSAAIKDCSEKTLQRELLALVARGVLKKEGERRWSTYVLF